MFQQCINLSNLGFQHFGQLVSFFDISVSISISSRRFAGRLVGFLVTSARLSLFELSALILRSSYAPMVKFDGEPYKDLFIFLSWPKDAYCLVAFGSEGRIASHELTVDLYNFIRLNKGGTPGSVFQRRR